MKSQRFCLAFAVLVTTILIGTASAATCNNATMTGVWGYQVGAAVGQFTSDGNGNLTGSQTVSNNGVIVTQTYTGTYSILSRCTGTVTINFTGGGSAHSTLVIYNGGKAVQVINTDPGIVAGGVGLSQGVVTCGLTGARAIFAANLFGKIPSIGPIQYVAQVALDGAGHVSGSGTFDVNGTTVTRAITGTYTENTDCTGTLQMTPSGLSPLNFNFVVVNGGKETLLLETDANTVVAGNMQR